MKTPESVQNTKERRLLLMPIFFITEESISQQSTLTPRTFPCISLARSESHATPKQISVMIHFQGVGPPPPSMLLSAEEFCQ